MHLDIVMYSVSQAAAGRVPLVDYLVQYGFFGTLLAPPFRATGTSVLAVSLVMNALQWLALACIAVVVFRRIMTLALAIGACAALFFVMGAWGPLRHQPDPYFQYYPLRILFPAISLWLVSRWMDRPRTRNTGLISCIAGIAILWNIDSGIAVAGAWIGLLAFQVLSAHVRHEDVRAAWAQLALAAVTAAVPLLLFGLWLRWRAGAPVDFGAAFVTQRLYYLQGVYMMPLPRRPHPWQFVLAVHAGAFLAGCAHALGKLANPRARLLHYLAFLGLGLFPYYQGRSHNLVLLTVAWPAVLIVFLLADWLWTLARSGRMRRGLAVAMTAPVLAFGVLCTVVLVRDVPGLTRLARRAWSARTAPLLPGVAGNVAFIRDNSGGRDAVVLAEFQGVYFAETGLATSIRAPSVLEVVTRAQAAAIVGEIRRLRPERLFLGAPYLEPGPDNPFDSLRSFLAERYRLQASTTAPQLWLYVRRDPE